MKQKEETRMKNEKWKIEKGKKSMYDVPRKEVKDDGDEEVSRCHKFPNETVTGLLR